MPYVLTPGLLIRSPVQPGRGTVIGYLNKTIKVAKKQINYKRSLVHMGRYFSPLKRYFLWKHTPDRLVGEPAGITLVESVLKGGRELFGCSDGGACRATRRHSSRKVQSVAAGVRPVVEDHTWREETESIRRVGLIVSFGWTVPFRQILRITIPMSLRSQSEVWIRAV